jgi:hypothetical protein
MPTLRTSRLRGRAAGSPPAPDSGISPQPADSKDERERAEPERAPQGSGGGALAGRRGPDSGAGEALARVLRELDAVLLTRERIRTALDAAAERGCLTRRDADELLSELLRRGRAQTEELLARADALLRPSDEQHKAPARGAGLSELPGRPEGEPEHAGRGSAEPLPLPIPDYEELTVAQVSERLGELTSTQLRQLREYERRHANRKSLLERIERELEGR